MATCQSGMAASFCGLSLLSVQGPVSDFTWSSWGFHPRYRLTHPRQCFTVLVTSLLPVWMFITAFQSIFRWKTVSNVCFNCISLIINVMSFKVFMFISHFIFYEVKYFQLMYSASYHPYATYILPLFFKFKAFWLQETQGHFEVA